MLAAFGKDRWHQEELVIGLPLNPPPSILNPKQVASTKGCNRTVLGDLCNDDLKHISSRYGVTVADLLWWNPDLRGACCPKPYTINPAPCALTPCWMHSTASYGVPLNCL